MVLIYKRKNHTAQFFSQQLSPTVALEMVAIPGGRFQMGSPEDEKGRSNHEGPQHPVTVLSFCMGKYPVTQAQWQQVMGNNPANFKGEDRPVENVSWEDAVAFCGRLNGLTGWDYRLPSEAEWEYACRAGTTTPFHFGEIITTDFSNYDGIDDLNGIWASSYGRGSKGIFRKETTPVGAFSPNAFGLYDMHGNVWEWCVDHWHRNYEGAPTDGSAWLSEEKDSFRLLRGGSWGRNPQYCRSAFRLYNSHVYRYSGVGFRVSCSAARTFP
jgi:formylglycine-generating enzyme required for sulfatase activity